MNGKTKKFYRGTIAWKNSTSTNIFQLSSKNESLLFLCLYACVCIWWSFLAQGEEFYRRSILLSHLGYWVLYFFFFFPSPSHRLHILQQKRIIWPWAAKSYGMSGSSANLGRRSHIAPAGCNGFPCPRDIYPTKIKGLITNSK